MLRNTLVALALTATAQAQVTETFESGSNAAGWEVWWSNHNTVESSGGNPGGYLHLDNLAGPATCHFLRTFSTVWPSAFSGDYRAQGVSSIGIDVNVVSGAYGGIWEVSLFNDAGTPNDTADDCGVKLSSSQVPPLVPGWTSYDFPLPAASATIPAGWAPDGACTAGNADVIWNQTIVDVDYVVFRLDTNPAVFCSFTNWDMGVDNIRLQTAQLGQTYCSPAVANSTGQPAAIGASGSVVAADNDVILSASGMPQNQFGYFLNSMTQASTFPVPNSEGVLCLGGSIGRYNTQIFNTGSTGEGSITLDLPNTPTPSGTTAIVAGETWNFTAWYRDNNPSPTSNFTDGLAITFQ